MKLSGTRYDSKDLAGCGMHSRQTNEPHQKRLIIIPLQAILYQDL